MAKDDLHLVRVLKQGDRGKDVVALLRMIARAGVGFPPPVKEANGKINDHFGAALETAVVKFQKKRGLMEQGVVGYITFKALLPLADAHDSALLRNHMKAQIGDWV